MNILRNFIGSCFAFALMLLPGLAADRLLLDPDWNDPGVARARTGAEAAAHAARPNAEARDRAAEVPLSLPRWGLANTLDHPTSDDHARARTALPSGNIPAWPSCARPSAEPKSVSDKSGLWYTDTYDYGCVVISISGDRSAKPDQSFPAGATLPDECSDPSAVDDSNETDTRGRFELLSLNRIPYEIVGRCSDEAEAFCRNRAARCALVGRLILRGGSPQ